MIEATPSSRIIYGFRNRAYVVIQQILPEPQASLLSGILLGVDVGLPVVVQEDFRATGTTHIVAISGYNITLLISIMSAVAVRLFGRRHVVSHFDHRLDRLHHHGRRQRLGGARFDHGRHHCAGDLSGRPDAALNSLFAAGFIMTLLDPNTLFDVGFQLSFVATLGLIVYARPFAHSTQRFLARLFNREWARRAVDILNDALLVTLAAQVTTLPLLMIYFRQISTVALIVNPLVLPAQSGVMTYGLFATGVGLHLDPAGSDRRVDGVAVSDVDAGRHRTLRAGAVCGRFRWITCRRSSWQATMPVLIGVTWYFKQPKEQRPAMIKKLLTPRRVLFAGGLIALLLVVALSWRTDARLHVYVLNVDGHPVFVQTPGGKQILIGGSNSPSGLLSTLGKLLPFWDRDIDPVIVPDASSDQLNGLSAVLDRYEVKQIMSTAVATE